MADEATIWEARSGKVNPPGRAAGGFYQQATSPAKAEEVGSAVLEVEEHSDRLIIE
jgi:hypothetical protein